jgi:hypothetical protein
MIQGLPASPWRSWLLGGSLFILQAFGCAPTAPAKAPVALEPKHVSTPAGVSLVSACTPTGPELCFNAIDDNCNGVIDEGCGIGTGLLQFTIAWGEPKADVDLLVTDPAGDRVSEANRSAPSGLRLDHDCPSEGCNGQNIENIFFEATEPPRGHYGVEIKLVDPHDAPLPVRVRFSARIGSRVLSAELELARADDRKLFSFEL